MFPAFMNSAFRRSGAATIVTVGALLLLLWPLGAEALIFDAVHNGGNPHFYFLPPLVRGLDLPGDFDPTLDTVVEIVDLSTDDVIAEFTTDDALRIDDDGSAYVVTWRTREFDLDSSHHYRIVVSINSVTLGFADVAVFDSSQEARDLQTDEYVEVVNGHNLHIKFAIQR
jgi:hypothetical protein